MKVDQHISELLYDHDCVIVPSFGGFLASYNHARIHPTQHTFFPPSKKIAFNSLLKQNDGLLANYLVNREKLSYTDALVQIEMIVNSWQKELTHGKKLVIERIGTFYLDSEKNLQFDPVKNINYLRDAFGLDAVQYLPVKREDTRGKIEKHVKEIVNRPSVKQEQQPLKLSKKVKHKVFRTLIVAATLLWFSFNLYLVTPNHFDLSSVNPFASEKKEIVKNETKPLATPVIAPSVSPAKVETVYVANTTPEKPVSIAPKQEEIKVEVKPVSPAPQTHVSSSGNKYFIIGGAFEINENAESFVKELQREGFSDAHILDTSKRLKMVCFSGFSSRSEAVKELENLKSHNKNGWIYSL